MLILICFHIYAPLGIWLKSEKNNEFKYNSKNPINTWWGL